MATYKITSYKKSTGNHVLVEGDTFEFDPFGATMNILRTDKGGVTEVNLSRNETGEHEGEYDEGRVTLWSLDGTSGGIERITSVREPDTGSFTAVQQGLYPSDSDPLPEPLSHAMI